MAVCPNSNLSQANTNVSVTNAEFRHPLKDAHAALDQAVLAAYSFSPKQDLLAQLLELNHAVPAKEKASEAVTAPGIPTTYGPDTKSLTSDDCIRPQI